MIVKMVKNEKSIPLILKLGKSHNCKNALIKLCSRNRRMKWEKKEKQKNKQRNYIDNAIEEKLSNLWLNEKLEDGKEREEALNECNESNRCNAKQIEIKTTRKQPNKFIFFFLFTSVCLPSTLFTIGVRGSLDMHHINWNWLTVCSPVLLPLSLPSSSICWALCSIVFHFYRCLCLNT